MISLNSSLLQPQGESVKQLWLLNIDEAKKQSAATNKPILVSFSGSDWCAPCMRLARDLFETQAFYDLAKEHFILLKLDFPAKKKNKLSSSQAKHNETLAEMYNKKGSFPLVIIIDKNGAIIGTMQHPKKTTKEYILNLKGLIK